MRGRAAFVHEPLFGQLRHAVHGTQGIQQVARTAVPGCGNCACGYGAHARTKHRSPSAPPRASAAEARQIPRGTSWRPSPALSRRRWPSAAAIRAPHLARNSPARARPARRSAPLASRVRTRTRPDSIQKTPSLVAPSSNRVDPDSELAAREPGTNDCGAQCALPRQTFQERTQGLDYALGRRCPLVRRRGPAQELDLRARAKAQAVEHLRGQTRVAHDFIEKLAAAGSVSGPCPRRPALCRCAAPRPGCPFHRRSCRAPRVRARRCGPPSGG